MTSLTPKDSAGTAAELLALHQRHAELLVEIAMELKLPRMPLATVTAVSARLLAEMAQECLDAIARATVSTTEDSSADQQSGGKQ